MERVLTLLTAKDTKDALAAFKELEAKCLADPIYADTLEMFLPALTAESSCGRGRTFKFFAINARWDSRAVIENHLTEILGILDDSKTPTLRQCLPYLTYLAEAKPELIPIICEKLDSLKLDQYKVSMQGLIKRDIEQVLTEIKI